FGGRVRRALRLREALPELVLAYRARGISRIGAAPHRINQLLHVVTRCGLEGECRQNGVAEVEVGRIDAVRADAARIGSVMYNYLWFDGGKQSLHLARVHQVVIP